MNTLYVLLAELIEYVVAGAIVFIPYLGNRSYEESVIYYLLIITFCAVKSTIKRKE